MARKHSDQERGRRKREGGRGKGSILNKESNFKFLIRGQMQLILEENSMQSSVAIRSVTVIIKFSENSLRQTAHPLSGG